jgi:peptidoglycan/LPS O-acetylase OafA/YrhL
MGRLHTSSLSAGLSPALRAGSGDEGNWVIEAWRGIAAWMVVYAHYWAFSGSDWPALRLAHTGVDLFFVVSGFVFAPYLAGLPLQIVPFVVRRFFRIYPAYLLALAVYVAMKAASGQELRYLWEHLSFLHVQSREMAFYYNPPFWSLPAEVEFYLAVALVAPIMAWVARCHGARGVTGGLVLLGLAAACGRWALGQASEPADENLAALALHHLPGVLVEFMLGVAAWHLSRQRLSRSMRLGIFTLGFGLWWTLAVWFGQVGDGGVHESWARGLMGMLAAGCFAMVVAATAGHGHQADVGARLHVHWAVWAGKLSYGVYLFHIAALRAAEWAAPATGWGPEGVRWVAVVLTLLVAWLVYCCWENPCRLWGRRWASALERKRSGRLTAE